MFTEDKRVFPFEDAGDYVQLKSSEYPHGNVQNLAQGYEGMFKDDKRLFTFEDPGDYWIREMEKTLIDSDLDSHLQKERGWTVPHYYKVNNIS